MQFFKILLWFIGLTVGMPKSSEEVLGEPRFEPLGKSLERLKSFVKIMGDNLGDDLGEGFGEKFSDSLIKYLDGVKKYSTELENYDY